MSRQRAPHRGVKPARKALAHTTPARRAPRQDLYFFYCNPCAKYVKILKYIVKLFSKYIV